MIEPSIKKSNENKFDVSKKKEKSNKKDNDKKVQNLLDLVSNKNMNEKNSKGINSNKKRINSN